MKSICLLLYILCFPIWGVACEYGNDPRIENDLPALLKDIQNGKQTSPIRMTIGTYLGMSKQTRKAFGELITISSLACNPVSVFEGDVIGTVTIPFEEYYRTVARAIRKNRPESFHALVKHAQVENMDVETYVDLFGELPFPKSGGLKVRNRMKQLFPEAGHYDPKKESLKDPTIYGRMEDYTMARLFKAWGGQLILNKGCGPYALSPKFYTDQHYTDFSRHDRVRRISSKNQPLIMIRVQDMSAKFIDVSHYNIENCQF